MNIIVRFATPQDAGAINAMFDYYISETVATFNERNKSITERAEEIEQLLKSYPYLVAESEGRILGFACAEPVRQQTGYRFSVELTIYLSPDAPKRVGIGRLLYERLLGILTAQGYRTAYAVISGTNEDSIAFHKGFGFVEIARFKNSGYKNGMWLDAVWMQRELNPYDKELEAPVPFAEYRKTI